MNIYVNLYLFKQLSVNLYRSWFDLAASETRQR